MTCGGIDAGRGVLRVVPKGGVVPIWVPATPDAFVGVAGVVRREHPVFRDRHRLFALSCWVLYRLADDDGVTETLWGRYVYVFSALQAIVFTAVGWIFGREVHRSAAEAATKHANAARQDAKDAAEAAKQEAIRGHALAEAVKASVGAEGGVEAIGGGPTSETAPTSSHLSPSSRSPTSFIPRSFVCNRRRGDGRQRGGYGESRQPGGTRSTQGPDAELVAPRIGDHERLNVAPGNINPYRAAPPAVPTPVRGRRQRSSPRQRASGSSTAWAPSPAQTPAKRHRPAASRSPRACESPADPSHTTRRRS